jgi:hypothetical protein
MAPVCRGAPLALANAVVPEMMRQGWGRIVNVTTSLGTMLNAGSPTYGPSKAALEALSAIMAKDLDGTGVTVNVLVPGGITNTPMVSDEAGFERAKLIQPEVMVPPLLWLVSDVAGKSPVGAFSESIGIPSYLRNKRPRRLARRSRGPASRRCQSRRSVPRRPALMSGATTSTTPAGATTSNRCTTRGEMLCVGKTRILRRRLKYVKINRRTSRTLQKICHKWVYATKFEIVFGRSRRR